MYRSQKIHVHAESFIDGDAEVSGWYHDERVINRIRWDLSEAYPNVHVSP